MGGQFFQITIRLDVSSDKLGAEEMSGHPHNLLGPIFEQFNPFSTVHRVSYTVNYMVAYDIQEHTQYAL
jgi:hypothetical protein